MLRLLIKRWGGDNIKVHLRKRGCEIEWKMEVAQDCVHWEASVLLMLIFRFNLNFVSTYTLTT